LRLRRRALRNLNALTKSKFLIYGILLLLALSIALSVISFFPVDEAYTQKRIIIDSSFTLSPNETYRQGLGSFYGGENISIAISSNKSTSFNFTLLTYGEQQYNTTSTSDISYTFTAREDYYEAVFLAISTTTCNIIFQVSVSKNAVTYPFFWLMAPAKTLFFSSFGLALPLLMWKYGGDKDNITTKRSDPVLSQKDRRRLQIAILASLVFWLVLLAVNIYPLASFEDWYTDHARNPYSAELFTKVGFSIFDQPLGGIASSDIAFFKFVTWADMPHLYPLGSVFLFLPFGWLLENGVSQMLVFKSEIALFILVSHSCIYYFLKRYWNHELSFATLKRPWNKNLNLALKALSVYLLYIALVVYSANGMFDSVAFLFTLVAVSMFSEKRFDLFLLLGAVSLTFKYQAGIFLFPLVLVSLAKLLQQNKLSFLLRNRAVLAAVGLVAVNSFTAYLSFPFLASAKPEFIMNGVNAFNPHAQIPWLLQSFAVLLTLGVTLVCAVYMLNRCRLVSFFMVFSLLPCFTLPYFQTWYMPFFFVYLLFPKGKHSLEVTVIWLVFIVIMLSFGGFAYNPLQLLDNIRRVLGL